MSRPKCPKPNPVGQMREAYNEIRNRPLSQEQKRELIEIFQKQNRLNRKPPRKSARPQFDAET